MVALSPSCHHLVVIFSRLLFAMEKLKFEIENEDGAVRGTNTGGCTTINNSEYQIRYKYGSWMDRTG
jgi:hypothetical protein